MERFFYLFFYLSIIYSGIKYADIIIAGSQFNWFVWTFILLITAVNVIKIIVNMVRYGVNGS